MKAEVRLSLQYWLNVTVWYTTVYYHNMIKLYHKFMIYTNCGTQIKDYNYLLILNLYLSRLTIIKMIILTKHSKN